MPTDTFIQMTRAASVLVQFHGMSSRIDGAALQAARELVKTIPPVAAINKK